ncbi:oxidoreductase [Sphaerisporangium krabiense]|uniref:Flavin reductase (DIM6/NTAB) family NADH-FMN oxidoreductase RutF n=1 Tax=Sphaerisporangium krabiense TaxID=763782 RepID=A0A7W8Z6A9_9ACTN|nr:flavin reductase family protein [Sphaerisporangium krabiense]MBB5628302.1 flavin reductase (DIM6/NTAB) family NADH-FMN oxidoreductase RutF [Sphaerisporangium krabiense]GII66299.1 oxidoreductase [Sphaerisporangium krabiense]
MTTTSALLGGPATEMDGARFRAIMAEFPTAVTVISATGGDGPAGCTASAVLSLSLEPPSVLVSLASAGRTLRHTLAAGRFGVNVLAWRQRGLIRRFATGETCRRFDGVGHGRHLGVPVLDGAAAALVCDIAQAIPVYDHVLLVGLVRWARAGADHPALVHHRNSSHPTTREEPR